MNAGLGNADPISNWASPTKCYNAVGAMNILHVIPSFAPAWRYGGPVVAAVGLTRQLARQGHDVSVMTTNIDGPNDLNVPLETAVPMDGVDVWYYPVEHPRWYCFSRPLGDALRERVAEFDIVHIHSIFLWPTTIAAFWSRRRGVPYLIHAAGSLDPFSMSKSYAGWRVSASSRVKKWLYMNTLGRWDINRATAMHFTSKADMDASHALNVRPAGYLLPLGVDAASLDQPADGHGLREKHPELKDKKIVLFLGRVDPIKGLDILVSAIDDLATKRTDFALVVAGAGTVAYERKIASMVRVRGLEDRVVFLGMVEGEDKRVVLRDADVFVLPSHNENFPMAVLEAMAAGLPVVISDRAKIHDEVSAARAGIVTSPEPGEVAAAIDELLGDEDLRMRMGRAGRELTRDRLSWESAAENVALAYADIIGSRQQASSDAVPSSPR